MPSQDTKERAVADIREAWKNQEQREGRNPTAREIERKGTEIAERHDREESERKR